MISILFFLAGLVLIYWRTPISVLITKSQTGPLRKLFGDILDWDAPRIFGFFKLIVVVAGVLFLLGSVAAYYGPLDFSCGGHLCPRPPGYPL
jgi:hypothetical protein